MSGSGTAKVPVGFWVGGVISLLWNGFGGYDYTMTQLRDPGYLAQFPKAMVAALDAMPAWVTACWAIGVWGSVAGSVLWLMRRRQARAAFAVSFVAAVVSMGWQHIHGVPAPAALVVVLLAAIVVQWWVAGWATAKGWLV